MTVENLDILEAISFNTEYTVNNITAEYTVSDEVNNAINPIKNMQLRTKYWNEICFSWFSEKTAKDLLQELENSLEKDQLIRITTVLLEKWEKRIVHSSKTWDTLTTDFQDASSI